MKQIRLTIVVLLIAIVQVPAQHLGVNIPDAKKRGITMEKLDSIYSDGTSIDSSKAVFKTEAEQEGLSQAWNKLFQDLGSFLKQNRYSWSKPTPCFSKVYFSTDGKIDYFLYDFVGKGLAKPNTKKRTEFKALLNVFIADYKFAATAQSRFAQCGTVVYHP